MQRIYICVSLINLYSCRYSFKSTYYHKQVFNIKEVQ